MNLYSFIMTRLFIVFSIFCFGFIAETPKKPVIVIDDTRFQDIDLLWDLKALRNCYEIT